jgi:hypothetical protein
MAILLLDKLAMRSSINRLVNVSLHFLPGIRVSGYSMLVRLGTSDTRVVPVAEPCAAHRPRR